MSWLAPLYLAGLLAVSLPVIFHLIRRTPRGRMAFSSLMFLGPSPPRLTRRSRLDQVALLALRALILILMALAFARPFWRTESATEEPGDESPRLALLIDTSASMRRSGAWEAVRREALRSLEESPGGAALYSFDRELREHLGLAAAARLAPDAAAALVRARLDELEPTWFHTDLGRALAALADRLDAPGATGEDRAARIVLISDMQRGSALEDLNAVEWPSGVQVELRSVAGGEGNAGLHPAPPGYGREEDPEALWVRVANSRDAQRDQFELAWHPRDTGEGEAAGTALAFTVAPGESRVLRAPARPDGESSERLVLRGDECPFDNVLHHLPPDRQPLRVLSIGPDADGENGLDLFLASVFGPRGARPIEYVRVETSPDRIRPEEYPLAIAKLWKGEFPGNPAALGDYARGGGTLLAVLAGPFPEMPGSGTAALRELLSEPGLEVREADSGGEYALLAEIEFAHPLFAPFVDPRYSDFTRIRFWRHRRVQLVQGSQARIPASFDDGSPFLIERRLGRGNVFCLTSGWQRGESDLARSSKFPPLLLGMLGSTGALGGATASYRVGERVAIERREADSSGSVLRPDGARVALAGGQQWFGETELPGLYRVELEGRRSAFAVHVAPEESHTDALERAELARRGVALATPGVADVHAVAIRQQQSEELENEQQLWRWLLAAAVAALLLETIWAGRLARRSETTPMEARA